LMGSILSVLVDLLTLFCLAHRSSSALAAENLFLRKQLNLCVANCRNHAAIGV